MDLKDALDATLLRVIVTILAVEPFGDVEWFEVANRNAGADGQGEGVQVMRIPGIGL